MSNEENGMVMTTGDEARRLLSYMQEACIFHTPCGLRPASVSDIVDSRILWTDSPGRYGSTWVYVSSVDPDIVHTNGMPAFVVRNPKGDAFLPYNLEGFSVEYYSPELVEAVRSVKYTFPWAHTIESFAGGSWFAYEKGAVVSRIEPAANRGRYVRLVCDIPTHKNPNGYRILRVSEVLSEKVDA